MLQNPVILLPGEKLKWLRITTNGSNVDLDNISSNSNGITIIDVYQNCEHGMIGILYKENLNMRDQVEYIKDEASGNTVKTSKYNDLLVI